MKLLTIRQRNNWNSYMQIIRLLSLWYKKFVSTYRHKLQTVLGTREQFEYFDKANALSSHTRKKWILHTGAPREIKTENRYYIIIIQMQRNRIKNPNWHRDKRNSYPLTVTSFKLCFRY